MVFCRGPGAVSFTKDMVMGRMETQYSPKQFVNNQAELLHSGIARDM